MKLFVGQLREEKVICEKSALSKVYIGCLDSTFVGEKVFNVAGSRKKPYSEQSIL